MGPDALADNQPVSLDHESARRFRIAFANVGPVTPKAVSAALGVSDTTAKRLIRGDGSYSLDLWQAVAKLTDAPAWFIEHGWEGANVPDDVGLAEKVETLENEMDVVLRILQVRAGRAAGDAAPGSQPAHPEDREGRADTGPTR